MALFVCAIWSANGWRENWSAHLATSNYQFSKHSKSNNISSSSYKEPTRITPPGASRTSHETNLQTQTHKLGCTRATTWPLLLLLVLLLPALVKLPSANRLLCYQSVWCCCCGQVGGCLTIAPAGPTQANLTGSWLIEASEKIYHSSSGSINGWEVIIMNSLGFPVCWTNICSL